MPTTSKCLRCGQCCRDLSIPPSPKELRDSYLQWLHHDDEKLLKKLGAKDAHRYEEIYLIYPMLTPLYRSKKTGRYHYRCKHLVEGKKGGKCSCSIHRERPSMCMGFPFYRHERRIQIGSSMLGPSQYKGCGFNVGYDRTACGDANK